MATWEEILRIAREIDFQAVEQIYFKANGLKLKKRDISAEELFEANFFFNLSSEFEEQLKTIGEWTVHNVWDLNDSDRNMQNVRRLCDSYRWRKSMDV